MLWYRKTPTISISFDEAKQMGISTLRAPRPTVASLPPLRIACANARAPREMLRHKQREA